MNPWHDVRLLNAVAHGLMAMAALALVTAGIAWAVNRPGFALARVVVDAVPGRTLDQVDRALLRAAGAGRLTGNFFTVNLNEVRDTFEKVPWVRRAQVRRIWPATLQVSIEEHQPIAIWGDGRLVNRQGELFVANPAEVERDHALLEFSGPPGSEAEVTRRWTQLRDQLAPLSLAPEAVSLSARQAWTVRLDNGMQLVLGRDQGLPIADRVARWVAAYPGVQARLNREVVAVDLRHPNGFAIRAPGALDTSAAARAALKTPPKRPQ